MCGSSSSSTKSSSTRNTDNSRTDNRMAASDQAVVADGRARINVQRADARTLREIGDTLESTTLATLREAGGWREFVQEAYSGAQDLMQDANSGLETVATTTAKSDDLEVTETIVKLGIPAAALVAGAYFLSR